MGGQWTLPPMERLLRRVDRASNGCWHWTGIISSDGYARTGYLNRPGSQAHRVMYQLMTGRPLPPGQIITIDHVCHNEDPGCPGGPCMHRRCINPEHLVAKTMRDNVLAGRTPAAINKAKTHCKSGHAFDSTNTYIRPDGCRGCRICRAAAVVRHEVKRTEARRRKRES
mgnify:CR=1 FL=1